MTDKANLAQDKQVPEIQQPGLKFLEAAVYIMGGLLVLMLLGLIGGIVWKVSQRGEAPPPATQMLDLGLPAGAAVRSTQLDGDRLVVTTAAEIIIVDIRKNAVISRIAIAPR